MVKATTESVEIFPGRAGLQQRVLPAYRAPLFDALAAACQGGLSVFAGKAGREEAIASTDRFEVARFYPALNWSFVRAASPWYLLWQANLVEWLAHWNPDVLILEANSRYLSNRAAIRWMHARGRPVIGWGLGAPHQEGTTRTGRRLAASLLGSRRNYILSFDALVSYSKRGAEEYMALGAQPERVFVAPNSAVPRPVIPPPERTARFSGRPKVLFVGRLQSRKRLDNLLRACAALPASKQPELWIVGDGPARREIEGMAGAVYPQATLLGDRRGPELQSIFHAADLFVLPGTGGLAIQEAMAYGLPVIVAQGDGTQADLVRPENGWIVPPDDLLALETALREALEDPGRLRRMGAESFRVVAEEVNLEEMVKVFVRALCAVSYGESKFS